MKIFPDKSLILVAAALAILTPASAETYSQDFDGFDDGTIDLDDGSIMSGTANIVDDRLELTADGIAGGFASSVSNLLFQQFKKL